MSYEIIKSIMFRADGVYLESSSNNCTPKDYRRKKSDYLSKLLHEEGPIELYKQLLSLFIYGNYKAHARANSIAKGYSDLALRIKNDLRYIEAEDNYNMAEDGTPQVVSNWIKFKAVIETLIDESIYINKERIKN